MHIGIIGGTGVYDLGAALETCARRVATCSRTVELRVAAHAGHDVLFLARHGTDHSVPPHRIDYRANIDALRRQGCECIIATNAVGSICRDMQPGDLVLPDQFIDFTRGRAATFYDGEQGRVRHVDVTEPYCPALRRVACSLLSAGAIPVHPAGTYVCTEGPRFETPAEIRMFERLGGDLVGMTGVPEVVLAREAGICYLSVCVVTNFAAGISPEPLSGGEVTQLMAQRLPAVRDFILQLVAAVDATRDCRCRGEH